MKCRRKCSIFKECVSDWTKQLIFTYPNGKIHHKMFSDMQIMKSCYKFMRIVGICAPVDLNKGKIRSGFARSIIVLVAMFLCVFEPCTRYFLQHIDNLVDATGVGLMVSIGFFAAVSLISFTVYQKRILGTLLELQSIVEKYSDGSSLTNIFALAEQQSDWYTKRIASSLLGFVWILVLTASITISTILSAKGIGSEGWMVPYKAVFPIEQTTFGRYCVILTLQMLGGFVILTCVAVTLSYFVSVCIYLIAFVRSYEILVSNIDAMASDEHVNQIDCLAKFTQIVQYHNEIYEMADSLIYLMRPVIISTLYGNVIFFATSMFQCESMLNSKVSAELFVSFSGLWMSIAIMYVYSFFATKVTSCIQEIGDKMYETEWNSFPMGFRLFVQLTINRSQRSLYFHGFGLINCDMVNFSKLVNSAVSYYLMFRRMK